MSGSLEEQNKGNHTTYLKKIQAAKTILKIC